MSYPNLGAGPGIPTNGYFALSSVAAAANYQTVYTGTFTDGGTNLFVGLRAFVVGFAKNGGVNNSNPDGFLITANSTTTVTVNYGNGVSETAAGQLFLFATNSAGPAFYNGSFASAGPATGPAAGGLSWVPDSPSGVTLANYSTSWNYTNSETSTQSYIAALIAARNQQTPWNTPQGNSDPPTPPGLNVAQTTPSAPTGTFTQSGHAYITNASAVRLAGVPVSGFTYYQGQ